VATAVNEAQLLDVAWAGTAAHVERVVRGWRRCDRAAAARQAERRHLHHCLTTYVDDDGMLVIRGRLTPEQGAVVRRALDAAADRLIQEARHAAPPGELVEEVTAEQRRADALGLLAEAALAGEVLWIFARWRTARYEGKTGDVTAVLDHKRMAHVRFRPIERQLLVPEATLRPELDREDLRWMPAHRPVLPFNVANERRAA
jgi:hypothetical protein